MNKQNNISSEDKKDSFTKESQYVNQSKNEVYNTPTTSFVLTKTICRFKHANAMMDINKHNVYLLSNIGLRNYDDIVDKPYDPIEDQLKNLKTVELKMNVNEIFIFKTFDPLKILIYDLLENKLYLYVTTSLIYNAFIYIDNYLILIFDKYIEIVNMRKYKSSIFEKPEVMDYTYLISLSIKIHENENMLINKIPFEDNIYPVELPRNKQVKRILEEDYIEEDLIEINNPDKPDQDINDIKINCVKINSTFAIQYKVCFCVTTLSRSGKCLIKYIVNLNNKYETFNHIGFLITRLREGFYKPLLECTYLVQK